jgi:DNA repair protein RecN (Recombination protein N)
MLSLLKIKNIALIDSLEAEFGPGLNLLTGETGSGKSIIVDSLAALTGERVSSDLIKDGADSARIEGLFSILVTPELRAVMDESGIEIETEGETDLIVRRELSLSGKNRVFINDQLATTTLLKRIGPLLVDIHGQGEQASLFDPRSHLEMLDEFARTGDPMESVANAFREWNAIRDELAELKRDEAEKLQLVDILKFQVDELKRAGLKPGETDELEEEKRRLNNIEKLSGLSDEAYSLLYEMDGSAVSTLDQAIRRIEELTGFDTRFKDQLEGLQTARAVIDDASITVRDFRNHLEFSPERLEEIEGRLAEISRVTRKYGGSIEAAIEHLAESEKRLSNIETAELREKELTAVLAVKREAYLSAARALSDKRRTAAKRFEKEVEANLKAVALEKARFEVRIDTSFEDDSRYTASGPDRVEFYFSANPGEPPKPLAKIASGGEASRLMLILKTTVQAKGVEKSAVFDEIDAGIGGRVAEAVGSKLKGLAAGQQVLCVTHQAQIASKADRHFVVEKTMQRNRTTVGIRELDEAERVEELARMLAGEKITDAARENAREMLAAAG